MKQIKSLLATAGLLLMLLAMSSCFHKSVMNDGADDIESARIYNFSDGQYLVCLEAVFQATSKKSGQGITQISGYNDMRISVYDLNTGNLVVRKATGTQIDHAIAFLGCTEGNLWFYTMDDGLHSLNPKTLEPVVTQEMIFEKNPSLKDNLATCEWYQYSQFFQYSELKGVVLLSDNQGFRYEMNPKTLEAVKMPGDYTMPLERNDDPLEAYSSFDRKDINMAGDLRKHITWQSKTLDSLTTFLEGEFIADRNITRIYTTIEARKNAAVNNYNKYSRLVDSMKTQNKGAPFLYGSPQYILYRHYDDSLRTANSEKEDLERLMGYIVKDGHTSSYKQLLMPDSTSFFVFHRSNTAKDANVIVSRVQIKNHKQMKELWRTTLPALFFDPSAAEETDAFKIVFSDGSPDFGFSYINLVGNRLIIVWMLHVHCLDINTGKLLWKFRV